MADAEEILIIKGKRILLPDCISSGCIVVKNGKIVGIERGMDSTHLSSKAKVSLDNLYACTMTHTRNHINSIVPFFTLGLPIF